MQTRAKRKRFAFTLPNELWIYMFVFLDLANVSIMNQLCKQFKTLVDSSWRQIFKRDFPFGYDVYNIEDQFTRVNFKQTYHSIKTSTQNIPFIPANITLTKALEHHIIFLKLISYYGKTMFCGRLLDNLFYVYCLSNKSEKQTLISKLEQFLKLFQSYQLCKNYISMCSTGLVLHHVFGNRKEALVYYKIAVPLNIHYSFGCVVEIIHCIDEPIELQSISESYCQMFPTRKYAIWFALANRLLELEKDKNTILPIALESLKEYNQKQPDDIFVKLSQDAPKLDILKLIGDLYEENSESLAYYKTILDSSPKCSTIFKFDVTIKTVTILYSINNTIKEAFDYLYKIYHDCGYNERTICFKWMMKYIDKYLSDIRNTQTLDILQHCVKMCKHLADSPVLRNFVDMYQVIIHYFQGNFGLGVSEFGHALGYKENQQHSALIDAKQRYTRYIGKCYSRMGKFDDAARIFDLHTRDASLLMDIALMYLDRNETDTAFRFFLESKNLPPTLDFDYLSTLQFLEAKFSK
jgi:tetratricopeptide (TPR) repeat protein